MSEPTCSGCDASHDRQDCPVRWLNSREPVRDECCSLYRLGLCPDCEEREQAEAEAAAYDASIDNQIKWEQERRLGVD